MLKKILRDVNYRLLKFARLKVYDKYVKAHNDHFIVNVVVSQDHIERIKNELNKDRLLVVSFTEEGKSEEFAYVACYKLKGIIKNDGKF